LAKKQETPTAGRTDMELVAMDDVHSKNFHVRSTDLLARTHQLDAAITL
jgi:hypothetical protein